MKRIIDSLLSLSTNHPFFFGVLIGFMLALAVMWSYDRNPSLYEDSTITCEGFCLVIVDDK